MTQPNRPPGIPVRFSADKIWGDDGDDILYGGTSQQLASVESDAIYGGNGNDIIYGNGGDDFLYGDAGTDTVRGEVGNDTIKGGTGISYLYGGEGHDQLYYDPTTDLLLHDKLNVWIGDFIWPCRGAKYCGC